MSESVEQAGSPGGAGPRVFISYGRADAGVAERIHAGLEARGISAWMDTKDLEPGSSWLGEIEKAAHSVQAALILIGQHQLSPWQRGELEALLMLEREGRLRIIPIMLPGAGLKPEQLPLMLRRFQVVDFRSGLDEQGLAILAAGICGQPPLAPVTPPAASRRWLVVAVAGVVVLAGGLGALTFFGSRPEPPPPVPSALEQASDAGAPVPDAAPDVHPPAGPDGPVVNPVIKRTLAKATPSIDPRDSRPVVLVQPFSVQGSAPAVAALERVLPANIARALLGQGCLIINAAEARAGAARRRARFVVSGSAIEVGSMVRLHAQIADAGTGEILGQSETSVRTPHFMAGEQQLARDLLGAVTGVGLCAPPTTTARNGK